jgi:putative membrane protein
MHDVAPSKDLAGLTPEDPGVCTTTQLLSRQADDIGAMSRAGMIDRQARRVLVTINSAQVGASIGLERVRRQPIPRFYELFIRALAWFFAVMVCTRMGAGGHDGAVGITLAVVIMALVVVAERLGYLLDAPMSDDAFGLPLGRFCSQLTSDLLGGEDPVATASRH